MHIPFRAEGIPLGWQVYVLGGDFAILLVTVLPVGTKR